jgi:tagatose-1,6-bisphosphate aldolase non-catalytic subunit AgaZ/GatZ
MIMSARPGDKSPAGSSDTSVPHPARIYAYWLGGKDHYEADRKAAEEVIRLRPQVVASARANRAFLARVAHFLAADCGIRQFLDIGTGLPAPGSTHQIAQDIAPTAASSTSTTTHWCWCTRAPF